MVLSFVFAVVISRELTFYVICPPPEGAMAERTSILAYVTFNGVVCGFLYPLVVHWTWSKSGFASIFNKDPSITPVLDFAGDAPVHILGGICGMNMCHML